MHTTSLFNQEIYLVSRQLRVILPDAIAQHLDLGILYQSKNGETGCLFSTDCIAGRCTKPRSYPSTLMQYSVAPA